MPQEIKTRLLSDDEEANQQGPSSGSSNVRSAAPDSNSTSQPKENTENPAHNPAQPDGGHQEEHRPILGLTLSILSCLFYSLTAVVVKDLKPVQGPEILVIRGAMQIFIYLYLVWQNGNPLFGVPGHRLDLFIRGILGAVSLNLIYVAFMHISLGDATAIQNMSPIYVLFLAYFMLGEAVTILQIVVALLCCLGAIIVARPSFIWIHLFPNSFAAGVVESGSTMGFITAFACSIFSALAFIYVRKLRQTPVYTVTLYYSFLMAGLSAVFLPFFKGVWPLSGVQWIKLAATGVFGTIDQICLTLSLRYENAGIISMSRTITIVMSYVWDEIFFRSTPELTSLLGSGIIIVSLVIISLSRPGAWATIKKRCCCRNVPSTVSSISTSEDTEEKMPIISAENNRYS